MKSLEFFQKNLKFNTANQRGFGKSKPIDYRAASSITSLKMAFSDDGFSKLSNMIPEFENRFNELKNKLEQNDKKIETSINKIQENTEGLNHLQKLMIMERKLKNQYNLLMMQIVRR